MEIHLKKYEKECLKSTMLKHEETFKEQICELHRLYHVQKLLMSDMKNKKMMLQTTKDDSACRNFSLHATLSAQDTRHQSKDHLQMKTMIDLEHQAENFFIEDSEDASLESEIEEETDIELTLSTGSSNKKKKEKKKEPIYWNLDGSFPSMSARYDSTQTPVIGSHPWLNSRERLTGPSWESFCIEQKKIYSEEELSRKERQPLWLFPVLSLNVT